MPNRRQMIGAASALVAAGLVAKPALSIAQAGGPQKPKDPVQASTSHSLSPAVPPALPAGIIGLARQALDRHRDKVRNLDTLAVADFSTHSSKPRFHLVDLNSGAVRSFLVAHGKGSDPAHTGWLKSFSNEPGSEATSQGAYLTGDPYVGKHGLSRRLTGLDSDNSNALDRGIVIHSAWYVSEDMTRGQGIGRSQGCFALSAQDHATIMDALGAGCLLVAVKA